MRWLLIITGAMLSFVMAVPAQARVVERGGPVFDAPMVSTVELDGIRGMALPEARLTKGALVRIVEDESRGLFRQTQGIAPAIFDWWFSEVAQDMITANVRAAER